MRTVVLGIAAVAVAATAWFAARPSRAQAQVVLYVSGLEIKGASPVARIRLTNTAPSAGEVFSIHYTIRDASAGIALSTPGAGVGAQLLGGHSIELDLGKIVTLYRAARGYSPYTGVVQFVAFGEGGFTREFGPDTIHVEAVQTEGEAIRDAVVQWNVQ